MDSMTILVLNTTRLIGNPGQQREASNNNLQRQTNFPFGICPSPIKEAGKRQMFLRLRGAKKEVTWKTRGYPLIVRFGLIGKLRDLKSEGKEARQGQRKNLDLLNS